MLADNKIRQDFIHTFSNVMIIIAMDKNRATGAIDFLQSLTIALEDIQEHKINSEKFNSILADMMAQIMNYCGQNKIDIANMLFDKALSGEF